MVRKLLKMYDHNVWIKYVKSTNQMIGQIDEEFYWEVYNYKKLMKCKML